MKYFIALAISLLPFFAHSQVSWGLRGGLINAKWDVRSDLDSFARGLYDNRTGLLGGLVVEIRINEGFAIQPEINYAQKGTKNVYDISLPIIGDLTTTQQQKINYVEIPVMLKAGFGLGPARFDLQAGPSYSYALSGKFTSKTVLNGDETQSTEEDIDFEDGNFKRSDIGLQAGAALSVKIAGARFMLDARYLYGISDLEKGEEAKVNNRGVALTAGLLFSL